VSWSGADSEREDARFFPILDGQQFDQVWLDVVIRVGSSRWPTSMLKPRVDGSSCIGFALTAGETWNSHGYELQSIEKIDGAWHVRLRQDTYMSHGEGDRVRPYGIFLLTRVEGATIVVEEDVRDLVNAPPEWKERGRIVTPKLGALAPQPTGPQTAVVAPAETARFAPQVLAAVREYKSFRRVSDVPHWSPLSCRAPPGPGALVSASEDAQSHGRKLYHLFARQPEAYDDKLRHKDPKQDLDLAATPGEPLTPAPVGQVIVKEAWQPLEVEGAAPRNDAGFGLPADHATLDGKLYRRGEQSDLFVLLKLDPRTPDTDAGWVYATVRPDLSTVTAAGRIASCMGCHVKAEHDRQFGLPREWVAMRSLPAKK
jgi:hypothetical protein